MLMPKPHETKIEILQTDDRVSGFEGNYSNEDCGVEFWLNMRWDWAES